LDEIAINKGRYVGIYIIITINIWYKYKYNTGVIEQRTRKKSCAMYWILAIVCGPSLTIWRQHYINIGRAIEVETKIIRTKCNFDKKGYWDPY
jgi:hypothetical protein